MQNQEQEKTIQEQLQEKLDDLAKITPESLVRKGDLGKSLNFSDGVKHFELTLKLFSDLKETNLDDIPFQTLGTLLSITTDTINNFGEIITFEPKDQANPAEVRDNLIRRVEEQYLNQFNQISPILAYSFRKGIDFKSIINEARTTVSNIKEEAKMIDSSRKEVEDALKQVKRATAEVGVVEHSIIFKNEADSHKKKGYYWLGATIALAILTVIFGFWIVSYHIDKIVEMTTAQAIQVGISKIIILAVLYFGIVWSGRIYKAEQHNYVVNQHRHNALTTFEIFVKATEDVQTKNAVLIQATHSIFSPQHSGFTAHEKEFSPSPQASEIFKIFTGEGK